MDSVMKKLEEAIPNEYEAVFVAAKLSRKINALRQAAKEQVPPEEFTKLDQRKVTTVALDELASGKVKFERRQTLRKRKRLSISPETYRPVDR